MWLVVMISGLESSTELLLPSRYGVGITFSTLGYITGISEIDITHCLVVLLFGGFVVLCVNGWTAIR